jgi:hypothetical protein
MLANWWTNEQLFVRHLASLTKDKSEGYDLVPTKFEELAVGETTRRR